MKLRVKGVHRSCLDSTSGFNAMSGHIVVNGQLNVHETQKIIQAVKQDERNRYQ